MDYDSFGVRNRAAETGAFEIPIGFAGGLEDPVTGLVRFGLRDYEPATGRWTARDPILHDGGINLYAYSGSDPVAKRDPSGLDEEGGGATGDFGSDGTGGEGTGGTVGGFFEKVKEFFTREDTGMVVEALSEMEDMDGDSEIVKGAGRLKKGMDAIETVQDVAESVVIIQEAEATGEPRRGGPRLAPGLREGDRQDRPGRHLGTGAVDPCSTRPCRTMRDQNQKGSINYGVQRQLEMIGMP